MSLIFKDHQPRIAVYNVLERAKFLNDNGLIALDALHVALAEKAGADIFCTCDDRLLKKARALCDSGMKVLSPIELVVEGEK
ncbi:MAG: PIN domain-containing protein [Acidobacteriota bacterium]|nr:MAG: PIN domain-containing protein [Acidobacteriota bacterium]